MKIYFAGSIRGGRDDADRYNKIINHLKKYGEVLTEHVGSDLLTHKGENTLNDNQIHDRDMNWLLSSDIIIAEVTNPSLGVGYEIGRAIEHKKKIICLFYTKSNNRLSAMISGSKDVVLFNYNNLNQLINYLDKLLK
tara:strand:+ start:222 stop:632 length:411 start_codon:yes stop_codon:yes gene_type:complete